MAKSDDKKGPRIETHPLIAKLLPNPENPPRLVAIRGYIGPSSDKACICIHHDLDFSSYTEVPKDAIQHVEPFNPSRPNGPTVALVSADAPIRHVQQAKRAGEAGFLAGGIASTGLRGGQPAARSAAENNTDTCCCPSTLNPTDAGCRPEPPRPPKPPHGPGDNNTDTCCCPSTLTTTEGY